MLYGARNSIIVTRWPCQTSSGYLISFSCETQASSSWMFTIWLFSVKYVYIACLSILCCCCSEMEIYCVTCTRCRKSLLLCWCLTPTWTRSSSVGRLLDIFLPFIATCAYNSCPAKKELQQHVILLFPSKSCNKPTRFVPDSSSLLFSSWSNKCTPSQLSPLLAAPQISLHLLPLQELCHFLPDWMAIDLSLIC